jgi:hypothetical protein
MNDFIEEERALSYAKKKKVKRGGRAECLSNHSPCFFDRLYYCFILFVKNNRKRSILSCKEIETIVSG